VTKKLVGFFVGDRSSESFEKLCANISHIDAKFYATDKFSVALPKYIERLVKESK